MIKNWIFLVETLLKSACFEHIYTLFPQPGYGYVYVYSQTVFWYQFNKGQWCIKMKQNENSWILGIWRLHTTIEWPNLTFEQKSVSVITLGCINLDQILVLGSQYFYVFEKDCNSCPYPGVWYCGRII